MQRNMPSRITILHRYLTSQSFYPLFLSSLLAMLMYSARVLLGHSWNYINLVWNLFLAWAPYLCSLIAFALFRKDSSHWGRLILPGLLWLIFFPNAPYMVTDFLHLQLRPYIPLWYDILLLATFAWTGCFLAIASLRTMQFLVKRYLGAVFGWIFALAALGLSSLGIYLGRFERWNSWDLLLQPGAVIKDILLRMANPFDNLGFVGFTILVTAFLIVSYLTFTSISRLEAPGDSKSEAERTKNIR
jgi:uncharacterized membrane protein